MQGVFEFYRDLPPRPKRPERLFFALLPDSDTLRRVERFRQEFIGCRRLDTARIRADRLHLSLHHVGDYKRLRSKLIYASSQAGNVVSMPPFEITFRFVKSFEGAPAAGHRPRRRPLVLIGEGEALFEFHRLLGAALEKNGLRASARFTPHMTLSYGPKAVPAQAIEPIGFVVNQFALVHSRLWLSRYEVLQRWLLRS